MSNTSPEWVDQYKGQIARLLAPYPHVAPEVEPAEDDYTYPAEGVPTRWPSQEEQADPQAANYEWYTPAEYVLAARLVLGEIDLDPASCRAAQKVVKAGRYYTKETNGLTQPWTGRVFCNPPYAADLVKAFTRRVIATYAAGDVSAFVLLVNNCTDAQWFHDLLSRFSVCFTRGRIQFWRPGGGGLGTRQGQAFFYGGPDHLKFKQVFKQFGTVIVGDQARITPGDRVAEAVQLSLL